MDFNKNIYTKIVITVLLILTSLQWAGCTVNMASDHENDYLVGSKLAAVSPLRDSAGTENDTIALFDPTLKKIHQFDVLQMKKTRTVKVRFPKLKHFVLHDPKGNYIVDLSAQGVSIFDKNNQVVHDPVPLIARPQSAALNSALGYLVIYDEKMNVGLVQLNNNGAVINSVGLGPVLGTNSILSGDLLTNGVLALALSNGSIASVDVANTIIQGQWVYTTAVTEFSTMSWLAPVPSNTNRVLVKYVSGVALVDRVSGATVSKVDVSSSSSFIKLSKYVDGHVITKNWDGELKVFYTDGLEVKNRSMYKQNYSILRSQLDLVTDSWMMVGAESTIKLDKFSGDINLVQSARQMNRFRASDLKLSESKPLPDKAQIFMSLNYFFALYNSDLGYAVKQDYNTGRISEMRGFNVTEFDK